MPKKTRKQKIAAEKHKHHVRTAPKSYNIPRKQEIKIVDSPKNELSKVSSKKENTFFTKDLYKSIVISMGILLFEIGLYIATLYGISINKFLFL